MKLTLVLFVTCIAWLSGSIEFLANGEVYRQEKRTGYQTVTNANSRAARFIPDAKKLRKIIALSQEGHWALLGGGWLIIDGQLKNLTFPQALLYPSPVAFFDQRSVLLYAHQADSTTGALALFDIQRGSSKDVALLSEEPHAPAPSPDKRHVAFVSTRGRLQVVELDSHQTLDLAPAWKSSPSWAPDGDSIVFEKNRDRDQGSAFSEVAITSLTSGKVTVLDKGRSPSWSPNGDLIAYTTVDGKQLCVIDPNGAHRRILKNNLAAVMGPVVGPLVWSPDEKRLIFHRIHDSSSGDQHSEVYILNAITGDMKHLLSDEVVLAWR